MNDLLNKAKRFFKNKNTVTILGVILVLGLLYWGYNSQVTSSVTPTKVPVASMTIQPRTQITEGMITVIEVPNIAVATNVYTSTNAIIGLYSNVNTIIPQGSMFYRQALISESELPDSAFFDIAEGLIPYMFKVDIVSTFGNSIYPGSKIDIYMKAAEEGTNKVIFGKLFSDVTVVAVKDSEGNNVFENTEDDRKPAYLIFGLPEDIHILMRKASYIGAVELVPVPHGGTIASEGDIKVSTEYLKEYINVKSVLIEGQDSSTEKKDEVSDTELDDAINNLNKTN